jgi:hypothetical protein
MAARNCEWKRFNTDIIGLRFLKFSLVSRLNKKFESLCSELEWANAVITLMDDDDMMMMMMMIMVTSEFNGRFS